MKNLPSYEADIFASWQRSARTGLRPDLRAPGYRAPAEQLAHLQAAHKGALDALTACIAAIADTLPEQAIFLLTDAQGILLKKNP